MPVFRVLRESRELRVNEEPLDRQVQWDPLVTKDRLESVVFPVLRGLLVPKEAQANKENLESLEKKVPMDQLVVLEIKDPQVPLEHQELLDVMVPLESLDPLDLQVPRASTESLVPRVLKVFRAPLVSPDQREIMDLQEKMVNLDHVDPRGPEVTMAKMEIKEQLVRQDLLASKAREAELDLLVIKDSRVSQAQQETREKREEVAKLV